MLKQALCGLPRLPDMSFACKQKLAPEWNDSGPRAGNVKPIFSFVRACWHTKSPSNALVNPLTRLAVLELYWDELETIGL
jgi:hypothetical protein